MCCREGLALLLVVVLLQLPQATGQNECDGVLTFQADGDNEVFVLDTDVTAFCIECVNLSTGTDVFWSLVGRETISFFNATLPAEIAVTSTGLLFVANSTSVVPFQIDSCFDRDGNRNINIVVVPFDVAITDCQDCVTDCPEGSILIQCFDVATFDCVPTDNICNSILDCPTGLDEIGCDGCFDGVLLPCTDEALECVQIEDICNGVSVCPQQPDIIESISTILCDPNVVEIGECTGSEFPCEENPMICFSFNEICDGVAQCPGTDPLDEQSCDVFVFIRDNIVIVTLSGFSIAAFDLDQQLIFRGATVSIINIYCMDNPEECSIVTLRMKRQIGSFDAVIYFVESSGDDEIQVYLIAEPFNSTFELLSQQALFQAVQSSTAMASYSSAGFQVVNVREFGSGSGRGFRLSNGLIVFIVVVMLIPVVILLACLKGVSN